MESEPFHRSTPNLRLVNYPSMSETWCEIPPDESPAGTCEYCGQPYPTQNRLILHKGVEHLQQLDADEQDAFTATYSDEEAELRTFRLKALGVLVLRYFGFLITYVIVT